MNVNIAICDDNKVVCDQIESMILNYADETSFNVKIDIFYDGGSLIDYMKNEHDDYDLIYLDIEMNEFNGIDAGVAIRNELRDHKIQIVYISGKNQYDRQLFDVQPLLFIPKPIEENQLIKSINLAIEKLELKPKLYHYKKRKEYFNVQMEDIMYFENFGRSVKIITIDGVDTFVGNIKDVAKELAPYGFIQISQSVVVNYHFVSKYSREEIILINKEKIAIPKNKRNEVKEQFLRETDKYL
ncbi:response regulator transcription factor [Listeria monocytogenes]|nr:response regulator transcription factor [Listeria monocytogenes]EGC2922540.1 response regulator transcription factor [Listeria monocytogenes]EGC2934689.1 response regulator transcription factor [Listeria monocytogenes]EGC2983872.1 response regulator transcription factor [Listeria monocytogenes]